MHTTLPLSGLLPPRTSSDGVWQLGWWAEAVRRQMKSDESSDESINGVHVSATAIMVLCLFNADVEAAPGQVGWLCKSRKWKFQSLQLEQIGK